MDWYYAADGETKGPFSDEEFESLVGEGTVTPDTLVQNGDINEWTPFERVETLKGAEPPVDQVPEAHRLKEICTECGRLFFQDELVSFQGSLVCETCKPAFLQKLREGVQTTPMAYGGFWIRFGAKIIDYIIMTIVNYAIAIPLGWLIMPKMDPAGMSDPAAFKSVIIPSIILSLFQWGITIFYATWFIGKFGATPGKMACGLRVVTAENQKVSYLRAFARFFGEMLSGMILLIGYIMAGFDAEKRTLHDRICATRVIKKQG